jgi:hypothetical protein
MLGSAMLGINELNRQKNLIGNAVASLTEMHLTAITRLIDKINLSHGNY